MKTQVLPVDKDSIALGGKILREGGLVGMPTETVYGLGANALNRQAVRSIFEAKGRPGDNPLIVHVSCMEEVAPLVREIPKAAQRLMDAFWPGPMTIILPKAACIPTEVSAGLDTVGIRLPASDAARARWAWSQASSTRRARCPSSCVRVESRPRWWKRCLAA